MEIRAELGDPIGYVAAERDPFTGIAADAIAQRRDKQRSADEHARTLRTNAGLRPARRSRWLLPIGAAIVVLAGATVAVAALRPTGERDVSSTPTTFGVRAQATDLPTVLASSTTEGPPRTAAATTSTTAATAAATTVATSAGQSLAGFDGTWSIVSSNARITAASGNGQGATLTSTGGGHVSIEVGEPTPDALTGVTTLTDDGVAVLSCSRVTCEGSVENGSGGRGLVLARRGAAIVLDNGGSETCGLPVAPSTVISTERASAADPGQVTSFSFERTEVYTLSLSRTCDGSGAVALTWNAVAVRVAPGTRPTTVAPSTAPATAANRSTGGGGSSGGGGGSSTGPCNPCDISIPVG